MSLFPVAHLPKFNQHPFSEGLFVQNMNGALVEPSVCGPFPSADTLITLTAEVNECPRIHKAWAKASQALAQALEKQPRDYTQVQAGISSYSWNTCNLIRYSQCLRCLRDTNDLTHTSQGALGRFCADHACSLSYDRRPIDAALNNFEKAFNVEFHLRFLILRVKQLKHINAAVVKEAQIEQPPYFMSSEEYKKYVEYMGLINLAPSSLKQINHALFLVLFQGVTLDPESVDAYYVNAFIQSKELPHVLCFLIAHSENKLEKYLKGLESQKAQT